MQRNITANQILEMGVVTDAKSFPKLLRNLVFKLSSVLETLMTMMTQHFKWKAHVEANTPTRAWLFTSEAL